ncbi:MAG: adenylate/guanylate cyclase domain-containing protein [Candidatus Eiseniibacteriota bacterium]|nr:MAG: adenylate/guanylate cyclase domain-containing protein [Candidatus Eisenbacteria bacterium]
MADSRFYKTPPATDRPARELVACAGTAQEERYTFYSSIEIGRYSEGRETETGVLLVKDPTVSSRHCIITQSLDGRCFVRDVSRNGTRLDGKRLIPNLEVEIEEGQVISVSSEHEFRVTGEPDAAALSLASARSATMAISGVAMVTVLVGDIRDYTVLVRTAASKKLQQSVSRVFARLGREVAKHGGTVKEYQGDAIFAFWEEGSVEDHAVSACRAAVALDELACKLAADRSVWAVEEFPLKMDWALATGPVAIEGLGGDHPTGLSMIGEPVILAFRIEKFATDETGCILACPTTVEKASRTFKFKDLGEKHAKGFEKADRVYALMRAKRLLGF